MEDLVAEARDTLLVPLHKPFKVSSHLFFIDFIGPLDQTGKNLRQRPSCISSDDLPIELTCLSIVLISIGEVVLKEFAVLWDSSPEYFRLECLMEDLGSAASLWIGWEDISHHPQKYLERVDHNHALSYDKDPSLHRNLLRRRGRHQDVIQHLCLLGRLLELRCPVLPPGLHLQ